MSSREQSYLVIVYLFDHIRRIIITITIIIIIIIMGKRCYVTNCNRNYNSAYKVKVFMLQLRKGSQRKGNAGLGLYSEIIYKTQLTQLYANDTGQKVLKLGYTVVKKEPYSSFLLDGVKPSLIL